MSMVLSRRLKALEALAKLMLAKVGPESQPRASWVSPSGSRRTTAKVSRLGLIAGLVRRLRKR